MDSARQQTFEQLYRKYYLPLYRYALSWVDDEEAAKDIVSPLFSDLWDKGTVLLPSTSTAYLGQAV